MSAIISHLAALILIVVGSVGLLILTSPIVLLRIPSIDNLIRSRGEKRDYSRRIGHWHRALARALAYIFVCTYSSLRDVTLMVGQFAEACRVKVRLPCEVPPSQTRK